MPSTMAPMNAAKLRISLSSGCFWKKVGSMASIIAFFKIILK